MIEAVEIENDTTAFKEVAAHLPDAPVAPAHGIAAIALNMAMKYHDMTMIKDGAMYQQYKLEGRNMRGLELDMVFETAMKIEAHLLGSSERIAAMIVDALEVRVEDDPSPSADAPPDEHSPGDSR